MPKSCPTSLGAKHPTKARPPLGNLWLPLNVSLRPGALHSPAVTHFLFRPGIWKPERAQRAPRERLGPPTRALKGQMSQARACGGRGGSPGKGGGMLKKLGCEPRGVCCQIPQPPPFYPKEPPHPTCAMLNPVVGASLEGPTLPTPYCLVKLPSCPLLHILSSWVTISQTDGENPMRSCLPGTAHTAADGDR